MWGLDISADSKVWHVLDEILRLGCVRASQKGVFVAPYMFSLFPANLDAYNFVVVTRADAKLYATRSAQSPVLEHLQWDILTCLDPDDAEAPRHKVRAASGGVGHVRSSDVRSPIDYRATFQERNGRWLMTALVAGD